MKVGSQCVYGWKEKGKGTKKLVFEGESYDGNDDFLNLGKNLCRRINGRDNLQNQIVNIYTVSD